MYTTRLPTLVGALLSLSLLLAGCSLLSGNDGDPSVTIRTDDADFTPSPSTTVHLTVTNRSDAPIYYLCTGQIFLEEWVGGQRTNRWMVHGFEECLAPRPIAPSGSKRFDLLFLRTNALSRLDGAQFDAGAQYRLSIDLYADDEFDALLPREQRISNWFEILSPMDAANSTSGASGSSAFTNILSR